jgi:hypothetical protein
MSERSKLPEAFGLVVDEAYPEKGLYFRSDAERREFLRDLADRKPLLKGQRWRLWRAKAGEFWQAHGPDILAALIVLAALGLMALPMQTGDAEHLEADYEDCAARDV